SSQSSPGSSIPLPHVSPVLDEPESEPESDPELEASSVVDPEPSPAASPVVLPAVPRSSPEPELVVPAPSSVDAVSPASPVVSSACESAELADAPVWVGGNVVAL